MHGTNVGRQENHYVRFSPLVCQTNRNHLRIIIVIGPTQKPKRTNLIQSNFQAFELHNNEA